MVILARKNSRDSSVSTFAYPVNQRDSRDTMNANRFTISVLSNHRKKTLKTCRFVDEMNEILDINVKKKCTNKLPAFAKKKTLEEVARFGYFLVSRTKVGNRKARIEKKKDKFYEALLFSSRISPTTLKKSRFRTARTRLFIFARSVNRTRLSVKKNRSDPRKVLVVLPDGMETPTLIRRDSFSTAPYHKGKI